MSRKGNDVVFGPFDEFAKEGIGDSKCLRGERCGGGGNG